MQQKILEFIEKTEREKGIKVLLACETGSRAWGFPSPDSDYDIRLLYVHPRDWYLSVNNPTDAIDIMAENNELDLSGWELKKSLILLKKSNAALLERIQSPIVYRADAEFVQDFKEAAQACYSKIATMHHYLSMAKKMRTEIGDAEQFKLKKFFYTLRAATVCRYITERDTMPPIEFAKVYRAPDLPAAIVRRTEELIALKAERSEAYLHSAEPLVLRFIDECIAKAEAAKDSLPAGRCRTEHLNRLLRKYVNKYDN